MRPGARTGGSGPTDAVLTYRDVRTGIERLPVCMASQVVNTRFAEMPVDQTDFHHATPVYEDLDGWTEDLSGCRTFDDLPAKAQAYVLALEQLSGTRISAIGVGPERDDVIVRHDLLG